ALVIGCGPIGVAIIAALRHRGVESIVAADYSRMGRELAVTMGAHRRVDAAQEPPFDTAKPAVVFEAVGLPGIVNDVLRRAPMNTPLIGAGGCMERATRIRLFGTAQR